MEQAMYAQPHLTLIFSREAGGRSGQWGALQKLETPRLRLG